MGTLGDYFSKQCFKKFTYSKTKLIKSSALFWMFIQGRKLAILNAPCLLKLSNATIQPYPFTSPIKCKSHGIHEICSFVNFIFHTYFALL